MGAVKPAFIKKAAKELLEKYRDLFTGDFEHNKKVVQVLIKTDSKFVRNTIAGYITRIINRERRKKQLEESIGISETTH
ncbi:MAG: 30S ribosomal protein S17e [Thermoplasmata archaeon]|nr:30S ribosomal protein S17e [Euryarchaeota archaeon]RLF65389.1 MAG: 30S ribosomal protein S17e [Thermoplasmata archaeon]